MGYYKIHYLLGLGEVHGVFHQFCFEMFNQNFFFEQASLAFHKYPC